MAVKRGLGKGLSALFEATQSEYDESEAKQENVSRETISEQAAPTKKKSSKAAGEALPNVSHETIENSGGERIIELELSQIAPNKNQPRKNFEDETLAELAASIREYGVIQPIIVVFEPKAKAYSIVAGERRYRASALAGKTTIPAIVKAYDAAKISEVALVENVQREDLNAVEIAEGIRLLMDKYSYTQEQVAEKVGKSRPVIANYLRILNLPKKVIELLRNGSLSAGHARYLLSLSDEAAITKLAKVCVAKQWSIRQLELEIKKLSTQKPQGATPQPKSRELNALIDNLKRTLSTKVYALGTENKGKIIIEYYSQDDLERIQELLGK